MYHILVLSMVRAIEVFLGVEAGKEKGHAYSLTISPSHSSSFAMLAYSSLYAVWIARASSKHALGKRLGKRVTGAVIARDREGSISSDTKDNDVRTAKPLRIDQSLILERR